HDARFRQRSEEALSALALEVTEATDEHGAASGFLPAFDRRQIRQLRQPQHVNPVRKSNSIMHSSQRTSSSRGVHNWLVAAKRS
ncbi:hypothetical protein BGX26_008767, partial [Mortierella sp. AD094]